MTDVDAKKIELLPCPFCGGIGKIYQDQMCSDDHCVECQECNAETGWAPSEKSAIAAWNRRPTPPLAGDVETARSELIALTACRRCNCADCSDGYENHSHGCTNGPNCVETQKAWAAWQFKVSLVANRAADLIRTLSSRVEGAERATREECAKIADRIAESQMTYANKYDDIDGDRAEISSRTASSIAAAIRAGGKANG